MFSQYKLWRQNLPKKFEKRLTNSNRAIVFYCVFVLEWSVGMTRKSIADAKLSPYSKCMNYSATSTKRKQNR